jgi:hypothetical protein
MTRAALLFATFFLLPVSVFGQDSTPFHKGQWAAQFQAGSVFNSLGFIKFRSPTRALVLDVGIGGAHSERLMTDSTGANRFGGLNSNAFTRVRFGWRGYKGDGIATKVVSHYTLGVLAGFNHSASAFQNGSQESNGWMAGAFGDIGGTYLITSKFGIGALATASLSYQSSVTKGSGTRSRDWAIGGSVVNASLIATLFF